MSQALKLRSASTYLTLINPIKCVHVAFEPSPLGVTLQTVFECLTCRETLLWHPHLESWECPGCSYELSPEDAQKVIASAQAGLATLMRAVKGKGSWRLVTWLRRMLRLKAV